MKKLKIFFKELANIVTNLLTPAAALIVAIMELCQAPAAWIKAVKKIEYFLWELFGTKGDIDKLGK